MAPLLGAIVIAAAVWLWKGPVSLESGAAFGLMLLTTFVLRVVSNTLQLIRVRSWAVSTVFVVLMTVGVPLHRWDLWANLTGVLFIIYIIGLLASYQSRRPQVGVFYGSAALMTCTLLMPKLAWLVPAGIVAMLLPLRSLTPRSLTALILGLLLPYEVWGAWHLLDGDLIRAAIGQWQRLSTVSTDYFSSGNGLMETLKLNLLPPEREVVAIVVLYGLISIAHFLHTSLDDKTRTRMFFFSLIIQWPVLILILIFSPAPATAASAYAAGESALLWCPLCLVSAPLMAHYFVLSKKWPATVLFWLFLLLCLYLVLRPL